MLDTVIWNIGKSSFCFNETTFLFKVIIEYHIKNNEGQLLAVKLADNFEYLSYTSSDKDLFRVLKSEDFLKEFLIPKMKNQFKIWNLLHNLKENDFSFIEQNEIVDEILRLALHEEIKLSSIFQLIKEIDAKVDLKKALSVKLSNIPNKIKEKQQQYFYKDDSTVKLHNFIYHYDTSQTL